MTLLLDAEHRWVCPNCVTTAVTAKPNEVKFHHCPGLRGLWAPMVEDGVKAKTVAVEREDYVGSELVQTDADGRPVMAVEVHSGDTQHTTLYAPTAVAHLSF